MTYGCKKSCKFQIKHGMTQWAIPNVTNGTF